MFVNFEKQIPKFGKPLSLPGEEERDNGTH